MANLSHHALANLYPPFWQRVMQPIVPFPPRQDFAELTEKLCIAEGKVDEYSRLIVSLRAELRQYQDIVCYTCRERKLRANIATGFQPNPTRFAQPSQPIVTASTILSELTKTLTPSVQVTPTTSSVGAATASSSMPTCSSFPGRLYRSAATRRGPRHPAGHLGSNNSDGLIVATSSPDNPQSTTTVSDHSADADSQPEIPSISETATNADPTLPNPEWSVEYNLKKGLSFHVTKTFTFMHMVCCTKFSRDGRYLAVGLENGETHIYNMMTGSKKLMAQRSATVFYTDAPQTPSRIWTARFSLDNKYIATGGSDGQINIWEVDRMRLRAIFKHKSLVRCIDFSPNNRFLVSASSDGTVCLWNPRDGSKRTLFQHIFDFTSAVFSPDGRYIAAGNDDGFLRIWDARTCCLVTEREITDFNAVYVMSVIFTPDGKGIATGGKTAQCWDLGSHRETHSGRYVIKGPMKQIFEFKVHNITTVSFSSDNRWVVASSLDHNLYILEARSGACVCTLKAHKDRIWGADSSPTGHYIVSGGDDRCVRLWRYQAE